MPNLKKNILSVYSVSIINGLLGIIFVPLSLKMLGTDGYGLFSIYGVLASFVALADLGISKNLQRLLASERDRSFQVAHLQNALGIYLALSVLLIVFLPVWFSIIPAHLFPVSAKNLEDLRWIIFFVVLEYTIAIPAVMTQSLCIANERFDRYASYTFISGITRYALMFVGIFLFASPAIIVALVAARRIVDFFTAKWLMGGIPSQAWRPKLSFQIFKSVIGHSAALSTGQILQSTVIFIGTILVNRFFGLDALGKYRAAFDLASKVWIFSNGIGLVVFPRFVKNLSEHSRRELFYSNVYKLTTISWAGFNLLSILGIIFSPLLFTLLNIHEKEISDLFVVLLLGICLNAHANLSYELLQAAGKYKAITYGSALALALMVTVFFGLKQTYGVYAIGLAWIISQAAYSLIFDALTLSAMNFAMRSNIKATLTKMAILLPSLIMVLIYFDLLPGEIKLFPAICVSTFLILSVRSFRITLKGLGGNIHV
jgi:O-antigen/teichoic acid export membrane protein